MEEDFICSKHPHRMTEWDGYVYVCPGCVLGEEDLPDPSHDSSETTERTEA